MYLALYRKWRPKLFDDVVAQNHITSTLKNEVKFNKVAHAYLFTGPRGTGKTSCARIFSKALNCLNGVNGEPCCECEICRGIDGGTILDVLELDGASNNSVNDVKVLKDEASFVPSYCKFKIYIIDEVHMLSTSAFNALLKIMEEPPKHIIFILATTEVNKVPGTIVSRCQCFDFRRIDALSIERNLVKISNSENISLSEEAAKKLALLADGSMRDAVSFLDECFAVSSAITLDLVNNIFGFVDEIQVLNLFEAVVKAERFEALQIVEKVYENGKDLYSFCSEFVEFCREIVMCIICRGRVFDSKGRVFDVEGQVSSVFSEHVFSRILNFASSFSLNSITEILNESFECCENLKLALNRKLKFELFVLGLCAKFENDAGMASNNLGNNLNCADNVDELKTVKFSNSGKAANSEFGVVKGTNEGAEKVSVKEEALANKDSFSSESVSSPVSLLEEPSAKAELNEGIGSVEELKFDEPELKLEPFKDWSRILSDLKVELNSAMLSGFLVGSKAYVSADKLYIDFKNPIVSRKVLEKSADIARMIKQKTGQQYRIFVKKSEVKNENCELSGSNLNEFLKVAQELKIKTININEKS